MGYESDNDKGLKEGISSWVAIVCQMITVNSYSSVLHWEVRLPKENAILENCN